MGVQKIVIDNNDPTDFYIPESQSHLAEGFNMDPIGDRQYLEEGGDPMPMLTMGQDLDPDTVQNLNESLAGTMTAQKSAAAQGGPKAQSPGGRIQYAETPSVVSYASYDPQEGLFSPQGYPLE